MSEKSDRNTLPVKDFTSENTFLQLQLWLIKEHPLNVAGVFQVAESAGLSGGEAEYFVNKTNDPGVKKELNERTQKASDLGVKANKLNEELSFSK